MLMFFCAFFFLWWMRVEEYMFLSDTYCVSVCGDDDDDDIATILFSLSSLSLH